MSATVAIRSSAVVCAAGAGPAEVARTLADSPPCTVTHSTGGRDFPYFAIPIMPGGDWLTRAEVAAASIAGQIGPLPPETPLFVASSSFQMGWFESCPEPLELPRATASFALRLRAWLGLNGTCRCHSNACISGFSALAAAHAMIARGWIDEALVVGFEMANASTLAGFASLAMLSPSACRPFDADRDGLVLGEAVAAVHLARSGPWRLAGIATGLDTHSATAPAPCGAPLAEAIGIALTMAGAAPGTIDLVKLQAAGSPAADLAEAGALRTTFAGRMPPLVSLKPALGHTLGASGIAELAALLACLDAGFTPATAGFTRPDPEIGLFPAVDRSSAPVRRALLDLVGFGGGVAAAVVERTS